MARRLTPPGVGGLHVFGLEGKGLDAFLERCFRPVSSAGPSASLRFGRLMDGDEVVDEVVVHRLRPAAGAPARAELSIHGGVALERRVTALLENAGFEVRRDSPPARSTIEAEALEILGGAFATQTVLFLLAVLEGRLEREIRSLADALGDEVRRRAVADRLSTLIQRSDFGRALCEPPRVVLAGPVNAGKSTLFNRLLGVERTIVAEAPGTTRDVVAAWAEIEGYPFRVLDTAGARDDPADAVERSGIERSRRARASSNLVIEVCEPGDIEFENAGSIHVVAKADLLDPSERRDVADRVPAALLVSSTSGEGLEALRRRIVYRSPFAGPAVREFPCAFTDRQLGGLERALREIPRDPDRAAAALENVLRS